MLNQTIKEEARKTFDLAVKLYKDDPTDNKAYEALKSAANALSETSRLPDTGYVKDEHVSHRTGLATMKVTKLEASREEIL
jgi:hypothetical protein